MTAPAVDHISVCIPTYNRPGMLERCLDALRTQATSGFSYSILVVDNDPQHSASSVVRQHAISSPVEVIYLQEEVPNISLARNKAVANAVGEYLAFIDDDEVPESTWLQNLRETCRKFSADAVLGPVLPHYEGTPPDWLVKSGLCVRPSFATGTRLTNPRYLRTGNILLRRSLFEGLDAPFDPRLGRTGGEDVDALGRMVKMGKVFVWCDEARVFETVPVERQMLRYHLHRALLRGMTQADVEAFFSYGTIRSFVALMLYPVALPFMLVTRYHLYVKYLVKCCDHLAKLLAHLGLKVVRERTS